MRSLVVYYLECVNCHETYEIKEDLRECPRCGYPLFPRVSGLKKVTKEDRTGVWGWRKYIPFQENITHEITLHEGNTPLIRGERLEDYLGYSGIYIKDETRNPTGTFIDRGSAVLVSYVKSRDLRSLVIPSLGDLGISIGAYSKRAGLHTTVYLTKNLPVSKYYQTLLLADSVRIRDDYQSILNEIQRTRLKHIVTVYPWDPRLVAGYRTLVYEIANDLKDVQTVVVPIGNGVLLLSVWYAFQDLGLSPVIIGVKGAEIHPMIMDIAVERSKLLDLALSVVKESGGKIISVSVKNALEVSYMLAVLEGFLLEPAGASTLSALISDSSLEAPVVLITTGSTLKDPMMIEKMITRKRGKSIARSLGITKLRILEILSIEEKVHPYKVWKLLKDYYGISIALRNVYKHMKDLEDMGLIKRIEEKKLGKRKITYYTVSSCTHSHLFSCF